ncbi:TBX18 [Lepeophtheirus salmonis]|uniref:TBX18 n=1 Tax=Lepeophtheirus salmonis TaxID=72036 RepID=A0A7R8D452_LEPSM|nr:TBX18 [Lepeophtheirus salmonis]CAF3022995.1 TBX18 [Lepeophtheirus salmonis]
MEEEDSRKIPQKVVLSFSVEEILKRKTKTVEGSDVANDPILEDIKTRNKSLSDAETPNKEEDDRKFGILSKAGNGNDHYESGKANVSNFKDSYQRTGSMSNYVIYLDIEPYDDKRYRYIYQSSEWTVAGSGDIPPIVWNSPQNVVSFDKLKLTNNRSSIFDGHLCLHSMHKYIPRIHIQPCNSDMMNPDGSISEKALDTSLSTTFVFRETSFTTVTAYQNQQITKLKIESNPFAKGFREATRTRDPFFTDYLLYSSLYLPGFPQYGDERLSPYYQTPGMDLSVNPALMMMMMPSPHFATSSNVCSEFYKDSFNNGRIQYKAAVAFGGIMGFVKKGSIPSMAAGIVFGTAAAFGAYRFSSSPKKLPCRSGLMPAGVVAVLSFLMVLRYGYSAWSYGAFGHKSS